MNLAASASFRAAGAYGDVDPEPPDDEPRVCGYVNEDLAWSLARNGLFLSPCDQPAVPGHFHCYVTEAA